MARCNPKDELLRFPLRRSLDGDRELDIDEVEPRQLYPQTSIGEKDVQKRPETSQAMIFLPKKNSVLNGTNGGYCIHYWICYNTA